MVWVLLILLALCMAVVLCLAVSLYCAAMKKHSKGAEQPSASDSPATVTAPNGASANSLKASLIGWANDVTFLLFKIVGYIPLHFIRKLLYRGVFHMTIAPKAVIYYGLEARSPWNIEIGEGTIIGDHAILDARFGIKFGKNVNVSTGVWMWTLQHDVNSPTFSVSGEGKPIVIGDRAWVSSRSTVLPGVHIAEGCVIAAGAVATKNCDEPFTIYGGVPAKKIGKRNDQLIYSFDGKHRHFI